MKLQLDVLRHIIKRQSEAREHLVSFVTREAGASFDHYHPLWPTYQALCDALQWSKNLLDDFEVKA